MAKTSLPAWIGQSPDPVSDRKCTVLFQVQCFFLSLSVIQKKEEDDISMTPAEILNQFIL